MSQIIVTSRYLKSGSKKSQTKRRNYTKYIATRESVEKRTQNISDGSLPATEKQKQLIHDLTTEFPAAKKYLEYEDYTSKPTIENASELISAIIERNADVIGNRKNLVGYMALRPGAERHGAHGLFTDSDAPIDLNAAANEVANHPGNVWSHVISLRREDAVRLGYTNSYMWRELVKRHISDIANAQNIPLTELKWYAAFHDTTHHPHIHLLVYSKDPKYGYLTKEGIKKIRSVFANDIFQDDLRSIYEAQTLTRNELKVLSENLMKDLLDSADYGETDTELVEKMKQLRNKLKDEKGKKVYGYLPKEVKQIVDEIFSMLAKNERISKLYGKWCEFEKVKYKLYTQKEKEFPPLAENNEFRSVKNMIIKTVLEMDTSILTEKEISPPKPTESVSDDETVPIDYGDNLPTDDFTYAVEVDVSNDISRSEFTIKWSDNYKSACKKIYEKHSELKDYIEAEKLLLSEKAKGNVLAIYELGKLYSTDKLGAKDDERSFEYYKKALQGFMEIEPASGKLRSYVQYRIGKMHCYGLGTEKDYGQAFNWFERSAAMGNKFAQFSLANLYYYGSGVEQNYEKAYEWYMRSAQQGQPYAAYALAQMYANGEYVDKDELQAQLYYKQALAGFLKQEACGQADDNLFYKMGRMFRLGLGTDADIPKAIEYFGKAADLGNKNAKRAMALEYISGEHIRQDVDKGIEMLTELADGGDPMAAYRLGKLYLFGNNEVEKNKEKAIQWLTKSAEDGNEYAIALLQNADDHAQEMLASAVLGLFVSLSRVIADDYDRQKDYMSRHADSRLLRSINKLRWQLGEMGHNDG